MNSTQQRNYTDHNIFNVLFQNYSEKIYRLAGKFFANQTDREVAVQETFLRVYKNIHNFDRAKNTSAWIYRIGTNICI
ncbi:sigma factor [Paenibacillus mendelii]|uniref:Sigma factor n=1 Tax=Paenibacillus mendelii TaxID=206163 RepID=A0ABV6J472_9BACL